MNSNNNNAKKDVQLTYSQEYKLVYLLTAKEMARYMSTQYPNNNPCHQHNGKKRHTNRKKGDDPKFEDKDNNATGTAGAHIGDVTKHEDSTASIGSC